MSILFRMKEWLTVVQLARSWTAELAGAAQNPQQFEQNLVLLLLEDIVNGRFDEAGPLVEGRRLGLRVITPDNRAGFLEGHQTQDIVRSGGPALTFFLHRLVVMKEAALDFAQRHQLPPPSWWTVDFAASTEPPNDLVLEGPDAIPTAAPRTSPATSLTRSRGPKPKKLESVKEAMRDDIRNGRRTLADLWVMPEKDLAAEYGNVSRDTARKARKAVSEFVEKSFFDK